MKRVATLNLLPDVPDDIRVAVLDVTARLKDLPGALLPVLHGVQQALGYVPEDAVPLIASELNLSRADVHGVITFYHFFRRTPPGKRVIYVCRAESCQAVGNMSITVYIPRDAGALSLGAEEVAKAIALHAGENNLDVRVVRNGSRGLYWLEPMVEVETSEGRVAYGPVEADDVAGLFDADFLHAGRHPLSLGLTEEIGYLKSQQRLTFARVGIVDPRSLDDYRAHGGYRGLETALAMSAADIVQAVTDSGLRGRGGAAFPAGIKWKTCMDAPASQRYIVCNADEGDSGTYADRMVMEGDPFVLIEGMTIAAIASAAHSALG
ncbi:MAG: hypothetical protein WDW36_005734 [Sanguina aurantia]